MQNPLIRPTGDTASAQPGVSRRGFLRVAGLSAVALGGAGLLAACGSSSDASGTSSSAAASGSAAAGGAVAAGTYGDVKVQLSWIKNIEFSGEYFADSKGYFTDAGFNAVELLAGPTDTDAAVVAGKVDIGLSAPDATATLISEQGAPLKIIGSTFQKNPFCILSLEEGKPIATVEDLKGKKIGIQAGPNQTIFAGFLKANGIDPADLEQVAVGFEITELLQNNVDGHMAYLTNEPILAKAQGKTPVTLGFADNGLPLTAETFTVTDDTIAEKRDMLKAFLLAEIKGWQDAIADPAGGAKLAVETYGKDQNLDLAEQTEEAEAQLKLIVSDETDANGIFTLSEAKQAEIIGALEAIGITDVAAADLFDLSMLTEVYAENPELMG